jgi:hypothetical protein
MSDDNELKQLVKSLFDDYLDYTEVSDNDIEFQPIYISSCRVLMTEKLDKLLTRLRELSHE